MLNFKSHLLAIGILFVSNCTSNKPLDNFPLSTSNSSAIPETIVYKTKNDYYDKIPVILSDDKTKIVSYPGPRDIFYNGKLALPTKLDSGYLLDNRGINKNVAFLSITYEEYCKQKDVLSMSEMMNMVIDKNPLTKMYNCGNRYQYKNIISDLNSIIDSAKLSHFKTLL